jgi:hypothetical protein
MNIDSVDRHIESGLHYWPTPFGLSQGATNHYESATTQSPGNNDPWLVGTPGIFITPP